MANTLDNGSDYITRCSKIISLIEAGESPNSYDAIGDTPVMIAVDWNILSVAKVLFGFGADLSIANNRGVNALHMATIVDINTAITWVLDHSTISIDSTDDNGINAILIAMESGNFHAVKLLFERGASLTRANNDRRNLLHIAVENGADEHVRWVLDNSTIDVNSADKDGTTAIRRCLRYNDLASAKLLVERGANLFAKDNDGERAIDITNDEGELLGIQVLRHAEKLRRSAIKEFLLLSKAYQCPNRREAAGISIDADVETILSRCRSVRLAASVFGIDKLLDNIGSFIIRSDVIIRDRSIPKPSDAVKLRVEAALKAASSSSSSSGSSSKKRGRS